jgi:tripartite-type tricarboxylate transporter receptor subunit TctC
MSPLARLFPALFALLGLGISMAGAQDFPARDVTYVIPFAEGGESHVSAELQRPAFKAMTGHDFRFEFHPGGGGAIAWAGLNDLSGDGYTVMGVNMPHVVLQPQQEEPAYTTDDLTPVYWFHYTPDAIVVSSDSQFETLADLVAHAEEKPEVLTFAGSGSGTANHLAQVTFDKLAGIETTYIPFKGTAAASTALAVGQVMAQWGYTTVGIAERDRVRLLAVAMEERHPAFPDVPTFRELGYEMVDGAYRGVAVPASTPEELRQRWSDMLAGINADPDFRAAMEKAGFALVDVPYGKMDTFMKEKSETYLNAATAAGVL